MRSPRIAGSHVPSDRAPAPWSTHAVDLVHRVDAHLQQAHLLARLRRPSEMLRRQNGALAVQPKLLAGEFEATADRPGIRSGAGHPSPECRVILLALPGLPDEREYPRGAIGQLAHQPFAEDILHLERQSQEHIAGVLDAGRRNRLEDRLDLTVVET